MQLTAAVLGSALASSGLWALVGRRADKDDAERKMLVGLAHDRIVHLGMAYVERGYITQDPLMSGQASAGQQGHPQRRMIS